jgi:hypothetical protein
MQFEYLQEFCQLKGKSQQFFLASSLYKYISHPILQSLDNCEFILSDRTIQSNSVFVSLISNKARKNFQRTSPSCIDLSDFSQGSLIEDLFSIRKGSSFFFGQYDHQCLIELFLYLETDFWKYFCILQTLSEIQLCLSSPSFYVSTENTLCSYVLNQITENRSNLILLCDILLGASPRNSLNEIISSIQFSEIDLTLFTSLTSVFSTHFLVCDEFSICNIDFIELLSLQREMISLDHIFQIPLDFSIFTNQIKIEENENTQLIFTPGKERRVQSFKEIIITNHKPQTLKSYLQIELKSYIINFV